MNIGEALPRNAQHFPRKPALVDKWRSVTHLDLHLRTNRIANYLLKTGIVPGDVVGLSCGNRCEHFEILFALAKIGAIAAPFDHNWSSRESQAMIAYFQPKAFFLEERKEMLHWRIFSITTWIRSGSSVLMGHNLHLAEDMTNPYPRGSRRILLSRLMEKTFF